MNPFKDKTFLTLKQRWYRKLQSSGFEDAEDQRGLLKECHSFRFIAASDSMPQTMACEQAWAKSADLRREAKQTYYQMASTFLHHHNFLSETEREIWRLHSEGVALRKIACQLKHRKAPMYTNKVRMVVDRLRKAMLGR